MIGARVIQLVDGPGRSVGGQLGGRPTVSTALSRAGLPCLLVEERYESELAQSAAVLDGVDGALQRLSDGNYGSCETCGAPIQGADLEADPTRRRCEQHLGLGDPSLGE